MPTIISGGVILNKKDGECAHPSCTKYVDFFKEDKPPIGWGTIVFERGTNAGTTGRQTYVVCPDHTIDFVERQTRLSLRSKFTRVILESPFAGDIAKNLKYLRKAMRNCLKNGEAPFASHALYTQEGVLNDGDNNERQLGIEAGLAWSEVAKKAIVFSDLGITEGMNIGIQRHKENGIAVEYRKIQETSNE